MKRSSKPRVPTGTYTDRDLMLQAIEIARENLPMSAVGKILKREIREEYWVGRSRKI
jgi:acyl-CoA synthetase (AMP-forming)/AMP-acid ligase II